MSAATAHAENPFAGQGSVLLDIGGEVGALVVTMPAAMEGDEVEIRPTHGGHAHAHHPHVAVVNRPVVGASLVFAEVVEGSYGLYPKETDDLRLTVTVVGGEVTSAEWPG